MSKRVEQLIQDYPKLVMRRDCLRNQLQNFKGVTEQEMIDTTSDAVTKNVDWTRVWGKKYPIRISSFVGKVCITWDVRIQRILFS